MPPDEIHQNKSIIVSGITQKVFQTVQKGFQELVKEKLRETNIKEHVREVLDRIISRQQNLLDLVAQPGIDLVSPDFFEPTFTPKSQTPGRNLPPFDLKDIEVQQQSRQLGRSGLPFPGQFNPISMESVDCIGEQCEAFPRLRYRVRVIQPGRSLNNYEYSPQMLQRSARLLENVPVQAYGFGQYQPMFSHLPADLEPMQPSGFALNRVGLLKEAAYENHPDFGEGLFATLVVDKAAERWAKAILDEATTPGGNGTGVSIFADIDGDYGYDDFADEMYIKVNAIKNFRSVDLASQPAAGGAIVAAMEDAGWEQREYLEQLKEEIQKLSIEEIIEARRGYHRR